MCTPTDPAYTTYGIPSELPDLGRPQGSFTCDVSNCKFFVWGATEWKPEDVPPPPPPASEYGCDTSTYSCVRPAPPGTTTYPSFTDCADNCRHPPPSSWGCDGTTGTCSVLPPGTKGYSSKGACEESCTPAAQYGCDTSTYACVTPPPSGASASPTKAACEETCVAPPMYGCDTSTYTCSSPPPSGASAYPSLTECAENCEAPPTSYPPTKSYNWTSAQRQQFKDRVLSKMLPTSTSKWDCYISKMQMFPYEVVEPALMSQSRSADAPNNTVLGSMIWAWFIVAMYDCGDGTMATKYMVAKGIIKACIAAGNCMCNTGEYPALYKCYVKALRTDYKPLMLMAAMDRAKSDAEKQAAARAAFAYLASEHGCNVCLTS